MAIWVKWWVDVYRQGGPQREILLGFAGDWNLCGMGSAFMGAIWGFKAFRFSFFAVAGANPNL